MKFPTSKNLIVAGAAGVLLGVLIILGIRFVTYEPDEYVHHHANFAVFINGERETFDQPLYYEESSAVACTLDEVERPIQRAHMHDEVNDIIHVHDSAVTWGNFFQNINWNVDTNFIKSVDTLYQADDDNQLTFILNGERVFEIKNRVIDSEDRLLISYGDRDAAEEQYETVASTAGEYNTKPDPASCSGAREATFTDRLKNLF